MPYEAMKDCLDCKGEGHYPLDEEHPHEMLTPVNGGQEPQSCYECDGSGKEKDCDKCDDDGDMNGPDESYKACTTCDGEGHFPCQHCGGEGWLPEVCGACHEEIDDPGYYHTMCYIGDGELYCTDCVDFSCKTCDGDGRIPHPKVTVEGKEYPTVPASCSCCGANPHDKDKPRKNVAYAWERVPDFDWYVYEARVVDSDGVYFARLCGDVDGDGCLTDVERAAPGEREGQKMIAELLDDDTDGAQTEIEDLNFHFGFPQ